RKNKNKAPEEQAVAQQPERVVDERDEGAAEKHDDAQEQAVALEQQRVVDERDEGAAEKHDDAQEQAVAQEPHGRRPQEKPGKKGNKESKKKKTRRGVVGAKRTNLEEECPVIERFTRQFKLSSDKRSLRKAPLEELVTAAEQQQALLNEGLSVFKAGLEFRTELIERIKSLYNLNNHDAALIKALDEVHRLGCSLASDGEGEDEAHTVVATALTSVARTAFQKAVSGKTSELLEAMKSRNTLESWVSEKKATAWASKKDGKKKTAGDQRSDAAKSQLETKVVCWLRNLLRDAMVVANAAAGEELHEFTEEEDKKKDKAIIIVELCSELGAVITKYSQRLIEVNGEDVKKVLQEAVMKIGSTTSGHQIKGLCDEACRKISEGVFSSLKGALRVPTVSGAPDNQDAEDADIQDAEDADIQDAENQDAKETEDQDADDLAKEANVERLKLTYDHLRGSRTAAGAEENKELPLTILLSGSVKGKALSQDLRLSKNQARAFQALGERAEASQREGPLEINLLIGDKFAVDWLIRDLITLLRSLQLGNCDYAKVAKQAKVVARRGFRVTADAQIKSKNPRKKKKDQKEKVKKKKKDQKKEKDQRKDKDKDQGKPGAVEIFDATLAWWTEIAASIVSVHHGRRKFGKEKFKIPAWTLQASAKRLAQTTLQFSKEIKPLGDDVLHLGPFIARPSGSHRDDKTGVSRKRRDGIELLSDEKLVCDVDDPTSNEHQLIIVDEIWGQFGGIVSKMDTTRSSGGEMDKASQRLKRVNGGRRSKLLPASKRGVEVVVPAGTKVVFRELTFILRGVRRKNDGTLKVSRAAAHLSFSSHLESERVYLEAGPVVRPQLRRQARQSHPPSKVASQTPETSSSPLPEPRTEVEMNDWLKGKAHYPLMPPVPGTKKWSFKDYFAEDKTQEWVVACFKKLKLEEWLNEDKEKEKKPPKFRRARKRVTKLATLCWEFARSKQKDVGDDGQKIAESFEASPRHEFPWDPPTAVMGSRFVAVTPLGDQAKDNWKAMVGEGLKISMPGTKPDDPDRERTVFNVAVADPGVDTLASTIAVAQARTISYGFGTQAKRENTILKKARRQQSKAATLEAELENLRQGGGLSPEKKVLEEKLTLAKQLRKHYEGQHKRHRSREHETVATHAAQFDLFAKASLSVKRLRSKHSKLGKRGNRRLSASAPQSWEREMEKALWSGFRTPKVLVQDLCEKSTTQQCANCACPNLKVGRSKVNYCAHCKFVGERDGGASGSIEDKFFAIESDMGEQKEADIVERRKQEINDRRLALLAKKPPASRSPITQHQDSRAAEVAVPGRTAAGS
ncbi:unnamed protein product, partial [Durusdinium trenchii]